MYYVLFILFYDFPIGKVSIKKTEGGGGVNPLSATKIVFFFVEKKMQNVKKRIT